MWTFIARLISGNWTRVEYEPPAHLGGGRWKAQNAQHVARQYDGTMPEGAVQRSVSRQKDGTYIYRVEKNT